MKREFPVSKSFSTLLRAPHDLFCSHGKDVPAAAAKSLPPELTLSLHGPGSGNTTFQKVQQYLSSLQDLAKGYERLNRRGNGIQKPTCPRWDQDQTNLQALSESAMVAALKILNGIVMPYARDDVAEDREQAVACNDIDSMASELVIEASPKRGDVTWGMTARGLFKAFSEVVELLPEA